LIGEDPGEFPALPTLNQEESLSIPREKFLEMLRRVAIAASRDPARYQLTGVFVEVDGDKMVMTATDGKRLTNDYIRIENPSGFAKRGIVPNRAVDALLKVLPKGDTDFGFSMGESELHVAFGSGELTSKLIEGTYPDYKVAVSQKMKETATVIFHFEEGRACMTTQARDIGESRIEIPISLQGEPIDIRFNPTYFIDALRCVLEEEIRLEFLDGAKPGSIRGSQHYRHMLMPLVVATA
jgi:DNA polymerase-3 subunit beta